MAEEFYSRVPYQKSHSHFTNDHVAGFPDLDPGPSFKDREKYIKDSLKYQILTGNGNQARKCMFTSILRFNHERML